MRPLDSTRKQIPNRARVWICNMPAREGLDARLTLKAVETGGATAAQTVLPQGIQASSLDLLVASEPGEALASQVEHSLS